MPRHLALLSWILLAALLNAASAAEPPAQPADVLRSLQPIGNDYSRGALDHYLQAFEATYGPTYRDVPLDVKAELLEWVLTRYHWSPWDQVLPRVALPDAPEHLIEYRHGADTSTWNGALLSALSYKYAATKDPQTLEKIVRLLRGLHLYLEVTGQPGLPARCVMSQPVADVNQTYTAPDGRVFYFRSDAAKGTLNQIVGGYAVMMMLVYPDLPAEVQAQSRQDLQDMAYHLVRHDYKLTERDGQRTKYGDLTPRLGPLGVPFNAQVAYMVVAAGGYFWGPDPAKQNAIQKAFDDLRMKHHVYYEDPRWHLVVPQRIAANPLVKGMNDRNHVCNAAYVGLLIERHDAQVRGRELDGKFCYELGRTMFWATRFLEDHRNALVNFQWAGLLSDPEMFVRMIPERERPGVLRQVEKLRAIGIEQLRRFRVNRFHVPGEKIETRTPQWVDARKRYDEYLWKSDAFQIWKPSGPTENPHTASIDFLHAYWLMRYWQLDR